VKIQPQWVLRPGKQTNKLPKTNGRRANVIFIDIKIFGVLGVDPLM
jgi:hypothetical protein